MTITEWQKTIHAYAMEKGWWPPEGRNVPEQLALMHSEISEALEEYRSNSTNLKAIYYQGPKPEGFGMELADCVIRILDTCEAYGINLEEYITEKHAYNMTRPYRHGGRAA